MVNRYRTGDVGAAAVVGFVAAIGVVTADERPNHEHPAAPASVGPINAEVRIRESRVQLDVQSTAIAEAEIARHQRARHGGVGQDIAAAPSLGGIERDE